ncbi:8-oxoguanine deaminase [Actinobacteria bacterium YIM 96077]|uniref:8-oxoguanine deaminase n=1 Tax=Phytoactinopolyspora halophila TaxID=1981511 RepID=A0A329R376_9ACTN|nr:8-oxoguanine deaminase [Phytoactinopolyspora halophila]AYY15210.1 8-oxoguanine deaminase [Actinobacteria bacterium YIM 96077]RAW18991.1 8-oxoguanine deaminase [Phytoactinopolyspora halophila]
MQERLVVDNATIATVDANDTEIDRGHLVVEDDTIVAVGEGPAPIHADDVPTRRVDGTGRLVTPGLINTHHHFYQWLTRGLAQDSTLFDWLVTLYPLWSRIDEDSVYVAARGSIAALLLSGCTTTSDHHYVFPREGGDVLGATIRAGRELGVRLHATRGSMDLGESAGGLPPDYAVEDLDTILDASVRAIETHHDPSPGAMVRIGIAPCSPFSVTTDLLRESASLARSHGVRLHTHGSETVDEDHYCLEQFGVRPVEYLDDLGWLGSDVWLAHCVHVEHTDIARFAESGTGVAHCPSSNGRLGAGIAPVPEMLEAGVPVGLGVDGAASNESGGAISEVRAALLFARARRGPEALTARQALRLATMGGARVLGRGDELGSLESGKQADLAVWDVDGFEHASIDDKIATLALGARPPLTLLAVNGRIVVEHDKLVTADTADIARETTTASRGLLQG